MSDNFDAIANGDKAVIKRNAAQCAGRLNDHVEDASFYNGVRVTVAGIGGLTAGAGGTVAAIADDEDEARAAAITAAVGGGVALIGTFVTSLVADPTERLSAHAKGSSSWDAATKEAFRVREIDMELQERGRTAPPSDPELAAREREDLLKLRLERKRRLASINDALGACRRDVAVSYRTVESQSQSPR